MSTSTFLQITDGTTDIVIADGTDPGTDYQLAYGQWSPRVARYRRSQLGGRGPYDDVSEEMILNIFGSDGADCLANLAALAALLDQADRWSYGENVDIVTIEYSPAGGTVSSTGSPLQAVIVGRAQDDAESVLSLPGDVEQVGNRSAILNVVFRFKRRGLWLHTSESKSSSAADNSEVMASASFAVDPEILSPTEIKITNINAGSKIGQVFIAVSDAAKGIIVVNADEFSLTEDYSSVNESANNARNTNVARYTPDGTTEESTASFYDFASGSETNTNSRRFSVFVSVRNNSSSTSFAMRAFFLGTQSLETFNTPLAVIPEDPGGETFGPSWIALGMVQIDTPPLRGMGVRVTASAASGTLDIDTFVLVDEDEGQSYVVEINESLTSFVEQDHSIDHRLLTDLTPAVLNTSTSPDILRSYSGDIAIHTKGDKIYAVVMGTGKNTDADQWRQLDAASTLTSCVLTATRTRGYLTPV